MNNDARGTYNANSQNETKTTMLKLSLCDYSDISLLRVANITVADANENNTNKKVIFENYDPFTDCIIEINNIQVVNAKDIDLIMLMYNLILHIDNYSATLGSLFQYYRDEPDLNNDSATVDSFKFKGKIIGGNGARNMEIMLPLKYLKDFSKTFETPLINYETNLILTFSANCVISSNAALN